MGRNRHIAVNGDSWRVVQYCKLAVQNCPLHDEKVCLVESLVTVRRIELNWKHMKRSSARMRMHEIVYPHTYAVFSRFIF